MSRIYESIIDRIRIGNFSINNAACLLSGSGKNAVNDNIIAILENAREDFGTGFPNLGIPPLEPLSLDDFHTYVFQKAIIKADIYLTSVTVAGLQEFIIENFNFKIVGLVVTFEIIIPKLTLNSKYKVHGKVASIIPFRPAGDAHAEASEVTVTGEATLGTNDGYLYIKTFSTAFDLDKIKVSLSGILGNGMINSLFNWVLTRTSDKVIQEQKENIAERASAFILDMVNDILKEVKLSDLIV